MERNEGVYVMRVAASITGMHPQTLRKYERAGLIEPARSKNLRMYSEEDIARLKAIKYMVETLGLNLAGVKIALKVQDTIYSARQHLSATELNPNRRRRALKVLEEGLGLFGAN